MAIIDYASFTIPFPKTENAPTGRIYHDRVSRTFGLMQELLPTIVSYDKELTTTKAMRPYSDGWFAPVMGWRMYTHPERKEASIHFSGQACHQVRQAGAMQELMSVMVVHGKRLDLAEDYEKFDPVEVLQAGFSSRIKSKSDIQSQTGTTVYIGSRKSEAFCRVYSYTEPHPRAKTTRCEFELKGERAIAAAQAALHHGEQAAYKAVGQRFEFNHNVLQSSMEGYAPTLITETHKRTLAGTERWLISQAAPAFKRLIQEGVIDNPREWIRTYFLGGEEDERLF